MDKLDKQILSEISLDLTIESNPYKYIAKKLGIETDELIDRLKSMKEKGYLKRVAPIIRHRKTEYLFNGLAAFSICQEEKKELLNRLKERENISHVYERKTNKNWPYNVYGMTHGKSKEQVEDTVKSILSGLNVDSYKILYSTREFKKTSPNMDYLLKI